MVAFVVTRTDDYLEHHGVKGQKWGVRRYQNDDGSYTKEGKERYNKKYRTEDGSMTEAGRKKYEKALKTAQGEKISGKQMAKNAAKRGAVGATVGSSVSQLADRINLRKKFDETVSTGIDVVPYDDPDFLKKVEDVPFNPDNVVPIGFHTDRTTGKRVDDYGYVFTNANFLSPGKARDFAISMTRNLLAAPTSGALIGAGVGALGSVTVDSIHNLKIDRAKKFVEKYKAAYEKTYGGQA